MKTFINMYSLPMSMINLQNLRNVLLKQKEDLQKADDSIRREIVDEILKWFDDKRVMILTGIRRCGKSTLLRQLMTHEKSYCYVNFDDERFLDFQAQDFEKLNELLIEVYGNPSIYFFDEIQNIERFETFVRRLQDDGKKVVITGSNASLLSKEFGTRLTGRYKVFELFPFSFTEYLHFKNIVLEKDWSYQTQKRVEVKKAFNDFLITGGFPEYLKTQNKEYIKDVFESILYKDIIARYSIKRQKVIKELVGILATNISSAFTYNSLKTALHLGNSITVKEYISYLANSYLFFELAKFDYSLRKSLNSPKKIYLIDTAFSQVAGFNFFPNSGKNIENVVFVELKRRKKEVYYYAESGECDFVVKDGPRISQAVQVCFSFEKDNRDRECMGILGAVKKFKLKEGLIITSDQEEEFKQDGIKIKVVPVWKWLLE